MVGTEHAHTRQLTDGLTPLTLHECLVWFGWLYDHKPHRNTNQHALKYGEQIKRTRTINNRFNNRFKEYTVGQEEFFVPKARKQ